MNMPGMTGFDVLKQIRDHLHARRAAGGDGHRRSARATISWRRSSSAPTTTSPSRSTFPSCSRASRRSSRGSRPSARSRRAKSAMRWPCAAPTTASGTGGSTPTRATSRRGGARCSATTSRRCSRRSNAWYERVHPNDLGPLKAALEEHLVGSTTHFEYEHRVQSSPDSYRWVLARAVAVRDADGHGGARGGIAHRHHRRQGGRRADRPPEPRAADGSPGTPARARQAPSRVPGGRDVPGSRPLQGDQRQPRPPRRRRAARARPRGGSTAACAAPTRWRALPRAARRATT